jgi:hypothetical protein
MKRTRRRIQNQIEHQEEEHRRQLLRRRIELAHAGVRAFQMRRMGEAVKNFHTYIRILEDWKGCREGGLSPSLFDIQKDVAELLLISGVYWDLVKLYDRTKSVEKHKEFRHYMEKYILFSKGMPFQGLCGETLRKYISNEKPVHREEFKNAYKFITGSQCFVATSLIDHLGAETLPKLREFRDGPLARTSAGRGFTRWYYRSGPGLAAFVDRWPEAARRGAARMLDLMAVVVSSATSRSARDGK